MKRFITVFLTIILLGIVLSSSVYAKVEKRDKPYVTDPSIYDHLTASTDNPGGINSRSARHEAADSSASWKKISSRQFAVLVEEFQKFWYVNDPDDLQDRFEEFLKTKNVDPVQLEDYDEFMEAWVDNYDDDPDFDDIESYIWNSDEPEDPDWDDEEELERMLEEYPEGTFDPDNINDFEEIIDEGSDW